MICNASYIRSTNSVIRHPHTNRRGYNLCCIDSLGNYVIAAREESLRRDMSHIPISGDWTPETTQQSQRSPFPILYVHHENAHKQCSSNKCVIANTWHKHAHSKCKISVGLRDATSGISVGPTLQKQLLHCQHFLFPKFHVRF